MVIRLGSRIQKMAFCRQKYIFENIFTLSDTIRIRSSSFTTISTSGIIREAADRMNGVSLPTSQSSTPSLQLCDHLLSDKGPGQRGKILANVQNILTNNLQKALHIEEDIGIETILTITISSLAQDEFDH